MEQRMMNVTMRSLTPKNKVNLRVIAWGYSLMTMKMIWMLIFDEFDGDNLYVEEVNDDDMITNVANLGTMDTSHWIIDITTRLENKSTLCSGKSTLCDTHTRVSTARVFGVQWYKNNPCTLLSRILSILNLDWLQYTRSVWIIFFFNDFMRYLPTGPGPGSHKNPLNLSYFEEK